MLFLYALAIGVLLYLSVCVRLAVTHPFSSVYYACRDLYKYIRFRGWNVCKTGKIICYCALFGKGKTLSVVHYVSALYRRYNDKKIYDFSRKKWVTQKIHVISNVDLAIPYEKFVSLSQIVSCAENNAKVDEMNDTLTCVIALGDEFSVQLNSRKFKENIDPLFLNTLLTCRHHHISLVYDAQRFGHVDALLRQVTSYVVQCEKVWRYQVTRYYDAWDLENAQNVQNVRPIRRTGWFVRDRDYNAYDTLACVGNLSKSCQEGDMLSEEEILQLQVNNPADMENVSHVSHRYARRAKKRHSA